MDLEAGLEHDLDEFFMDVVEDLAVYFQRLDDLLVCVLQCAASEIGCNHTPSGILASTMGSSKKDDELCSRATGLGSADCLWVLGKMYVVVEEVLEKNEVGFRRSL